MQLPDFGRFEEAEALLHEAASAAAEGLTDFGQQTYLTGLRVLLKSLDSDVKFCAGGREMAFGLMTQALIARLHTERGWKDHPHCKSLLLRKPLVITGIPRTGTTALHQLLAEDPQFQGLDHWLTSTPMPRPPRYLWNDHPHYQASERGLAQWYERVPALKKQHLVRADSVDECLEILMQDFVSNRFASTVAALSYDRWWQQQSELPSYQRMVDILRLIGNNDPDKTWLLKNPGHTWAASELLTVLPDACIVQTHRDPTVAIPSTASTIFTSRTAFEGEATDPEVLGRREAHIWRTALDRTLAARAGAADQFFDVRFSDFVSNPVRVVRAIYERFGFELTDETLARMTSWVQKHPQHEHGKHEVTAEQFGLTQAGLREYYWDYIERFDLH
jgi:Sulfotransferase family